MTVRSRQEIIQCIELIEEMYPKDAIVHAENSIGQYNLGVLAGLYIALGVYETFVELDMPFFMRNTFDGEIIE